MAGVLAAAGAFGYGSGHHNLDPHEVERLRRSIAMLRPDQPASLKREEAMRILEELQRLQRSDRRHAELLSRLRADLDESDRS